MASYKLFVVFALLAISIPSISAMEHIVGDDIGWTTNFDYQAWAKGKIFFVGDKLIFKYAKGCDNVLEVGAYGFKTCSASFWEKATTIFISGNDEITLKTPGKKWYISGFGDHCLKGNQKLAIYVMPQFSIFPFPVFAPTPAPPVTLPPTPAPPLTLSSHA